MMNGVVVLIAANMSSRIVSMSSSGMGCMTGSLSVIGVCMLNCTSSAVNKFMYAGFGLYFVYVYVVSFVWLNISHISLPRIVPVSVGVVGGSAFAK